MMITVDSNNSKEEVVDILLQHVDDRRTLPRVPVNDGVREKIDRRITVDEEEAESFRQFMDSIYMGQRYDVDYPVDVILTVDGRKRRMQARAVNISNSGMLLRVFKEDEAALQKATAIKLKFEILQGTMPEGYEMPVNMGLSLCVPAWEKMVKYRPDSSSLRR